MANEVPPASPRPEQTLHLERSQIDAASAPPAAPPEVVDQNQGTMVAGSVAAIPRAVSLTVRSGPDAGASFSLDTRPLYIGRAPDNGVVVSDPATSRRHARFEQRGPEHLVVDLGSANGTLVDGARVVERVLAGGSVITMGQNEFIVSIV